MPRRGKRRKGHRYEKDAVKSILEYANNRPRLLLWSQPVLRAKVRGRWLRGGVPGQPDITGILKTPFGPLRIDVEVKSARGSLDDKQKLYRKTVQHFTGIYIVARTAGDIEAVIGPIERRLWGLGEVRSDRAILKEVFLGRSS